MEGTAQIPEQRGVYCSVCGIYPAWERAPPGPLAGPLRGTKGKFWVWITVGSAGRGTGPWLAKACPHPPSRNTYNLSSPRPSKSKAHWILKLSHDAFRPPTPTWATWAWAFIVVVYLFTCSANPQ